MKYKTTYKFISFLTISMMLILPLTVLAQQNSVEPQNTPGGAIEAEAVQNAIIDVESNVNQTMWFVIGCVFPGVGLLSPYFYKPAIPAARMLGKSPEYIAIYTDTYKLEMEKRQFSAALIGTLAGGVAYGGCCLYSLFAQSLLLYDY